MKEESKENKKLWGESILCNYVPYRPVRKPLAKLTSKSGTDSNIVIDFSMQYKSQPVGSTSNVKPVSANVPKPLESKVNYCVFNSLASYMGYLKNSTNTIHKLRQNQHFS